MKIEIKSIFGSLLFEHDCDHNTIKKTLRLANLSGADLRGANLRWADLSWADLRGANLSGADLSGANLRGANLRGADLRWANLRWANLRGADLSGANLSDANLRGADLSGANLSGANLSDADLSGANGVNCAQLNFSSHGEKGRRISAVKSNEEIFVFCGCFKGTVSELRDYIDKGNEAHKKSRTLALDTVLMLLENNL